MASKPVNVLFLDDDMTMLLLLRQLFSGESFGTAFAGTPAEAMMHIDKGPVKVIVSDQTMPMVSGIEFLRKLKVSHPDIVRILLTGSTDVKVAKDAVNLAQVFHFFSKPYDREALLLTVRQAVDFYDSVLERRELLNAIQGKNEELQRVNLTIQSYYEKQREFTSTVSHELRTPLAAIKMALDIIISETPGPLTANQQTFLTKAKTNVDRLHRLINNVLDLSKMESGKMPLKLKEGDIVPVIEEAVDGQYLVAKGKGLSLVLKKEGNIRPLSFDRDRIVQVMINLLSNAIKFTNDGEITVTVSSPPGKNFVEIRVADTGPGIRSEDMGRLFEKFEQLEGDFNNKSGGTGLGLAICKTIVEGHAGKIWAESVLGHGTTMCFVLPIEERRSAGRL